ncbi:hypothetical protein C6P52_13820 [Enterococcus mundtii]|uniref:hypothetical protein n=1 Tax=Enterococcus mundtii TaxID=53346 RepID=UPI000D331870|nr:hypothetical protein [Enterococcus mundtii]PTO36630.1 hypothetical protein C6P52_13820 [Enterococcus mundtii]PTO42318.1 hypothetical protein C6P54_12020 [Enterococcus mundtii]
MKLIDLFLKNKIKKAKEYEALLALSKDSNLPLELINSLRIQQGLPVLVDRDWLPIPKKPNLLEIKLKDTDSVPEVWYKGERLGKYPECLVDISYHWNTGGTNDNGANDINIEYYSTPNDRHLDKKTIGHKRDA